MVGADYNPIISPRGVEIDHDPTAYGQSNILVSRDAINEIMKEASTY